MPQLSPLPAPKGPHPISLLEYSFKKQSKELYVLEMGRKNQQIFMRMRIYFSEQEENNTSFSENPQAMGYLFGLFIKLLGHE